MTIFLELSIIIMIAAFVSFIMKLLKQPLVIGYILAGIVVGPYFLNILHSTEYIELFSKIGITILLFIVGLGLNPFVIRDVGKISLITGLGQVIFTSIIGFFIVRALGFDNVASIYTAIALTFSSTIIILKLLSDKGDVNKLYGRISIGFLLVQDLVATIILLVVSTLSVSESANFIGLILVLVLKGAIAVAALFIISRYILPRISRFFAASQELLFVFSLAWGFGVSAAFAQLGFSVEIGALVAGVALSLSPFAYEIGARIKPLRDFFIILFFILLGSQLAIGDVGSLIMPAIVLSLFVLIGNPIIVLLLMNWLGYKRKTGFQAGLTVAQISEFSLILAALALSVGHITREVVSLITLVGIVTIAGSTYLILYSDQIYSRTEWFLKIFDMSGKKRRERSGGSKNHEVILFGYDRVGSDFVRAIEELGKSFIVVDFNPNSIRRMQEEGIPFRYGDAEDVEFLEELELQNAKLVISTIPDFKISLFLVKKYRRSNSTGIVVVISHDVEQTRQLYLAGASYVVMPHYLGARHAAHMVSKYGLDVAEFERERNHHLSELSRRNSD